MLDLAFSLFVILIVLVLSQAVLVCGFIRTLGKFSVPLLPDDQCPRAGVILCLRGTDPFLGDCLRSILSQDYPRYELFIIVDHPSDPAWPVAEAVVKEVGAKNVRLTSLTRRLETCSLKCSSVVQTMEDIDPAVEIVAQLDADTIPHKTWLKELATKLAEKNVGVATGNRWYMPVGSNGASLIRYIWNAAAVVQMYSYGIAWGGTLALKTKVIREVGLLDRWRNAFCEDTMLFAQLRKHGYKVGFVPSLMMVNRETCDLGGFYRWVRRQLLTARLYHPGWPLVVSHGFGTAFIPAAALLVGIWAWFSGGQDPNQAKILAYSLGGFALYQLAMLPLLVGMELAVRRIVRHRGESDRWTSPLVVLKLLWNLLPTQIVYTTALQSSLWVKQVDWRGILYSVGGPWKIRLLKYQPFGAPTEASTSNANPTESL